MRAPSVPMAPDGYEWRGSDLFAPDAGVVITVHRITRHDRPPGGTGMRYRVTAAQDQRTVYEGAFPTVDEARDQQLALARRLPRDPEFDMFGGLR